MLKTSGLLLAAVLSLGLGLTGCGDDGSEPATSSSTSQDGNAEALVKYSQCMRENGVPSFPDPVNGRLQLRVEPGSPLDPDDPAFQAAQEKCKSVEPPGLADGSGANGEMQEQMLKYVACMRENGVPKFPDPQGGRLQIGPEMGVDPQSPAFKQAEEACKSLLPGGSAPGGA